MTLFPSPRPRTGARVCRHVQFTVSGTAVPWLGQVPDTRAAQAAR